MNAPGQRSGIPKVMGILMIIFASLGLIGSLIGLTGGGDETGDAWKTFYSIELVFSLLGIGISALHLFAGLQAVRYKAAGPKLSVMYGALAIVIQIAYAVIIFAWIKPKLTAAAGGDFGEGDGGREMRRVAKSGADAVGSVLGTILLIKVILFSIWPTIVLALMSRPGAKQSCTN